MRGRLLLVSFVTALAAPPAAAHTAVRTLTFSYRSHTGTMRVAYVVLPGWYGPERHPPIPLVISPHGRGVGGAYNLRFWGTLPARGPFALVSPDGQGRRLAHYSWGYPGQIDDLARMPSLVRAAFPWLDIAPRRIYAIGDSMGGQRCCCCSASIEAFDSPASPRSTPSPTWRRATAPGR
jgi:poly(3-hydroxybutyrate) depolymerase